MTGQASKHIHCIKQAHCLSDQMSTCQGISVHGRKVQSGKKGSYCARSGVQQITGAMVAQPSGILPFGYFAVPLELTFSTPLTYSDHHLHKMVGKKLLYSSAEDA